MSYLNSVSSWLVLLTLFIGCLPSRPCSEIVLHRLMTVDSVGSYARLTIPVIQRYYIHLFFFKSSIWIPIQLSPLSTLPNRHLAHNLCGVRLGFDRYVYGKNVYIIAILDRHGYRCRCSSWSHQLSSEQSIEIGVLAIKDTHSSKSFITGPTTSSSWMKWWWLSHLNVPYN